MAGTISLLTGAAAEVLPPPQGSSPDRSANKRAESRSAPERSVPKETTPDVPEERAQDSRYLSALLEQARHAGLANRTTLTYERDLDDGKIYLYIKDKHTGEEVIRIPKKSLENASHRVDVRI